MPGAEVRLASLIVVSVISSASNIGLTYLFFEYSGTAELTEIGISSILSMAGGMTVLIFLEPVVENIKSKLLVPIRIHTSSFLSNKIANKVFDLPLDYTNSNPVGALSQLMEKAYFSAEKIIPSLFGKIFPIAFEVMVVSGVAVYFSGAVALTLPASFIIYVSVSSLEARKIGLTQEKEFNEAYKFYGYFTFLFSNYENVHYFGNKERKLREFREIEYEFSKSIEASAQTVENYSLLQNLIIGIGFSSTLVLFGNEILVKKTLPRSMLPFLALYAYRFPTILNKLPPAITDLQTAAVSLEKIIDFFNKKLDILEEPNANRLTLLPQTASIEFKGVSLKCGDQLIFDQLSFFVPPGKFYAIVGNSGVGKSTILKVLLRFVEIESGDVFISGKDIRGIALKSLRENFAVVPQTPLLENVSIEDNVRSGNFEASVISVLIAIFTAGLEDLDLKKPCGEGGQQTFWRSKAAGCYSPCID